MDIFWTSCSPAQQSVMLKDVRLLSFTQNQQEDVQTPGSFHSSWNESIKETLRSLMWDSCQRCKEPLEEIVKMNGRFFGVTEQTESFHRSLVLVQFYQCHIFCVFFRRKHHWVPRWVWTGRRRWPQLSLMTVCLLPPTTLSMSSIRLEPQEHQRYSSRGKWKSLLMSHANTSAHRAAAGRPAAAAGSHLLFHFVKQSQSNINTTIVT